MRPLARTTLAAWRCCCVRAEIDECASTPLLCGTHGNCTNTPGSFRCSCPEGFLNNGTYCNGITPHMLVRTVFTVLSCSCSLAVLDPTVGHTMDVLSPFIPVLCHLIDSSTESPVHVVMLSIQAVRGLPRLRAPGIVPCIISFSRQLRCFLMV